MTTTNRISNIEIHSNGLYLDALYERMGHDYTNVFEVGDEYIDCNSRFWSKFSNVSDILTDYKKLAAAEIKCCREVCLPPFIRNKIEEVKRTYFLIPGRNMPSIDRSEHEFYWNEMTGNDNTDNGTTSARKSSNDNTTKKSSKSTSSGKDSDVIQKGLSELMHHIAGYKSEVFNEFGLPESEFDEIIKEFGKVVSNPSVHLAFDDISSFSEVKLVRHILHAFQTFDTKNLSAQTTKVLSIVRSCISDVLSIVTVDELMNLRYSGFNLDDILDAKSEKEFKQVLQCVFLGLDPKDRREVVNTIDNHVDMLKRTIVPTNNIVADDIIEEVDSDIVEVGLITDKQSESSKQIVEDNTKSNTTDKPVEDNAKADDKQKTDNTSSVFIPDPSGNILRENVELYQYDANNDPMFYNEILGFTNTNISQYCSCNVRSLGNGIFELFVIRRDGSTTPYRIDMMTFGKPVCFLQTQSNCSYPVSMVTKTDIISQSIVNNAYHTLDGLMNLSSEDIWEYALYLNIDGSIPEIRNLPLSEYKALGHRLESIMAAVTKEVPEEWRGFKYRISEYNNKGDFKLIADSKVRITTSTEVVNYGTPVAIFVDGNKITIKSGKAKKRIKIKYNNK